MPDRFSDKQPYEEYYIEFDHTLDLEAATIATAVVTAMVVVTGADVSTVIIDAAKQLITDTSVMVWVRAGVSGTDYKITSRIVASDGSKYELDGLMLVMEK